MKIFKLIEYEFEGGKITAYVAKDVSSKKFEEELTKARDIARQKVKKAYEDNLDIYYDLEFLVNILVKEFNYVDCDFESKIHYRIDKDGEIHKQKLEYKNRKIC